MAWCHIYVEYSSAHGCDCCPPPPPGHVHAQLCPRRLFLQETRNLRSSTPPPPERCRRRGSAGGPPPTFRLRGLLAMCYSGDRRSDPAAPSAVSLVQRGGAGSATADTALSAADECGTARRAHPPAPWQHHFKAKSLIVRACLHVPTPPTSDPVPSMDGASPASPPLPPRSPPASPTRHPQPLLPGHLHSAGHRHRHRHVHRVRWAKAATLPPPRRRPG